MKKRLITLTLVLLVAFSLFAGCAGDKTPAQPALDFVGNEVTLPNEQPEKIISLTPANTEMLFALGLGEYVIGVDEYSDYPAEALDIEKVGDFSGPNIEAILALEPDLVLASNKLQIDAITQLIDLGINVVAVEATRYEDIFKSIELVGDLTKTSKQAKEITDQMKDDEKEIIKKAKKHADDPLSVYYVVSAGEYGNWTAGPESLIDDMFRLIGVKTVTELEVTAPWMDFSIEVLLEQDPDVLLVSSFAFLQISDFVAMDGYKELTACKEGNVFMVDGQITERPSVRIVEGLAEIYNAVYGEE